MVNYANLTAQSGTFLLSMSNICSQTKIQCQLSVQIPNWFHFNCFWRRARVKDVADIHGFNSLRWEDQQKIKEKLTAGSGWYRHGFQSPHYAGPYVLLNMV